MTSFYVKEIKEVMTTKDSQELVTYIYKLETKDKSFQINVKSINDLNITQGSYVDLHINEVNF